jgi:hypothetical protein
MQARRCTRSHIQWAYDDQPQQQIFEQPLFFANIQDHAEARLGSVTFRGFHFAA